MSQEEINSFLKKLEQYKKEVTATPEDASRFLEKIGILDKSGKVKKKYADICIQPDQA